jgi:chromate transporter
LGFNELVGENMKNFRDIINYYIVFFKIGLLTIGGGYTMLPIIEKEVVEKNKWATDEEVIDSYALAQSIPGVIAVNTATLLGNKMNGFWGALAASLGVITPSIIIIVIISMFFLEFRDVTQVANAFKGIRVAVLALLIMSVYKMIKKSIKDIWGILFAIVSFICVLFVKVSPVYIIIGAAIISIIIYYRKEKENDCS